MSTRLQASRHRRTKKLIWTVAENRKERGELGLSPSGSTISRPQAVLQAASIAQPYLRNLYINPLDRRTRSRHPHQTSQLNYQPTRLSNQSSTSTTTNPNLKIKTLIAILSLAVLATTSLLSARTSTPPQSPKAASSASGSNVVSCYNSSTKESNSGLLSAIVGPILANGCLGVSLNALDILDPIIDSAGMCGDN